MLFFLVSNLFFFFKSINGIVRYIILYIVYNNIRCIKIVSIKYFILIEEFMVVVYD